MINVLDLKQSSQKADKQSSKQGSGSSQDVGLSSLGLEFESRTQLLKKKKKFSSELSTWKKADNCGLNSAAF